MAGERQRAGVLNRKIVIALNAAWNLVNFRAGLIRALVAEGYEVVAVAPPDAYASQLNALGCRYVPLHMDNMGTHPGRDMLLLLRMGLILRRERPAVFLGYTIKPNVYGSLAAGLLGIPVINNIAGLGSVFGKQGLLARLVQQLYRTALARSARVFFQNEDDKRLFIERKLVPQAIAKRIPGSGVDLVKFRYSERLTPAPQSSTQALRFILIARMLWEKGVGEFVEAARIVRQQYPFATFQLLGFLDVQNPSAVSRAQVDKWVQEGVIQYLGTSDDVRVQLSNADCVVLPSYYREGVPRTLLEAAAMSRPIITTDWIGCREVVDDGVNGYLCEPKSAIDLAKKITSLIKLTPESRAEMGRQGRLKVEREFDEQLVIQQYLREIEDILSRSHPSN